eukprot:s3557_g2.t1
MLGSEWLEANFQPLLLAFTATSKIILVIPPRNGIETVEAKVVDARTRHSGEQTYQAEIYLGLDAQAAGRQRTMCVRGPCRVDKSQAQADADKMEDAAKDGIKAVREVAAEIKSARQAFAEVKRAIFLNRRVSSQGRAQLYSSLILSRLLFGCANWADISKSQLAQIEGQIMRHCRQIFDDGFWKEHTSTDCDLLHYHQLQTFRVLWARHRLIYLQHLAQHGHPFHLQLLYTALIKGGYKKFAMIFGGFQPSVNCPLRFPMMCRLRLGVLPWPHWLTFLHGSDWSSELADKCPADSDIFASSTARSGEADFVWWHPDRDSNLVQRVFDSLDTALLDLFSQECFTEIDFHNAVFAVLFAFDEPDMKMGRIFIHWIEQRFYDAIPALQTLMWT